VANGAENSVELLANRIKQGYSVVIFPEGTRSVNGEIKRFHKGAFYLAEQLKIDIQPILIHGTGYTMTKGDFLLKDGTISIKYLPRIKPNSPTFGIGYAEKTKLISAYFKEEFKRLSIEIEQPIYFKEQLIYNYLYKGPILEWKLKLKLLLEKNYQVFHELLPRKGKILDMGCGYGYRSYLLHWASKEREFTGIDNDGDKIELAENCFSKDNNISFIFAEALQFSFEAYDAIIIANLLFSLRPAEQKLLVEKCIKALSPGGKLIVRTKHRDSTQKQGGNIFKKLFLSETTINPNAAVLMDAATANDMKCSVLNADSSSTIFVIQREA
jgi:2-polyprenyl-3-methyl-5-hydroxy-6-metoxy-1,4-benzoquinol methylase